MQAIPLAIPVMGGLLAAKTPQTYWEEEPTFDPATPAWKQYEFIYDGFFDYSKKKNVVLIIPDAFGTDTFRRLTKKHPELLEWFSDFHFFTKQRSEGSTAISIPQILTACEPEECRKMVSVWNSEGALQKTLAENGFQTRLHAFYPEVYHVDHKWISNVRLKSKESLRKNLRWYYDLNETGFGQVGDMTFLRSVPIVFKPVDIEDLYILRRFFQNLGRTLRFTFRDEQFAQYIVDNPAAANSEKSVLLVMHLKGPHAPYNMNENFKYEAMTGIEGEERQALATLILIKRLIDDMKKTEVYDNTVIVIAGDHGNRRIGADEGMDVHPFAYNALLLVKRPNERNEAMVEHNVYTHVRDVTPTILDLLGLANLPGRFSVFDVPSDVGAQREVDYEAFWTEKRGDVNVALAKTGVNWRISSSIDLKRSELETHQGELWYFVGDNPDTWKKEALVVMSAVGDDVRFRGKPTIVRMNRTWHKFWYSRGRIDLTDVADGEYEVAFLLPQKDGSYAKNMLGTVAVTSGTANVL